MSSSSSTLSQKNTRLVVFSVVTAVAGISLLWYMQKQQRSKETTTQPSSPTKKTKSSSSSSTDIDPTPRRTNRSSPQSTTDAADASEQNEPEQEETATVPSTVDENTTTTTILSEEKLLHAQIEELDRKGKEFFKKKQYMEAAEAFTEALQCIPKTTTSTTPTSSSSSLLRQRITLLNNRSAMYEKAGVLELALDDCDALLELELTHTKARARRLRLLEALQRYVEALQEFCAMNLLFMQANRVNLRMGLPVPPPPVPQQKMEDLLNQILPQETEKYLARLWNSNNNDTADGGTTQKPRTLPGSYTILQLLKSYTNYNAWMAQAAQNGTVAKLTQQLEENEHAENNNKIHTADRATLLLRRGMRYVYDRKYEEASQDFEEAYAILQNHPDLIVMLEGDTQARILEWTGMVRHWHYQLDSALEILGKAADLEPDNALLLVKQAGIQLDAGRQDECLKLFDMALAIDPNNVDALLHRSNLRLMQGQPDTAKVDLEKCLKLRPNHTMARLRLASILFPMDKLPEAKRQLDLAESSEPNSSEVHSYRGELHFAQGEMDDAVREFETAISLEPSNPTPYVNAALAVLNTPPKIAGQPPDVAKATSLLEQAIRVDPQFAPAYIHLGQFQLASATNLTAARKVIDMYDRALENCRSPEEIKELVGMRIMGVAQVEAAQALKMETFNMQ